MSMSVDSDVAHGGRNLTHNTLCKMGLNWEFTAVGIISGQRHYSDEVLFCRADRVASQVKCSVVYAQCVAMHASQRKKHQIMLSLLSAVVPLLCSF